MLASSLNLLSAFLLLLFFVDPLRSNPQIPYPPNYERYYPLDPRFPSNPKILPEETIPPYVPRSSPIEGYNYQQIYSQNPWQSMKYYPDTQQLQETRHQAQKFYYNPEEFARDDGERDGFKGENGSFGVKYRDEERNEKNEEEIIEKMNILDRILKDDSIDEDIESNTIEDKIIPEETRRVVRQVRKQRPGFFWTLARITFETFNDTRSAIKQIGEIINEGIAPDSATQSTMTGASLTVAGRAMTANRTNVSDNSTRTNTTETATTTPTTTTTEAPFRITRNGLQSLLRRNIQGLVRLFNIEWRDALNQSEVSSREFRQDLGRQVGRYLQDNPAAY